jgi:hypothetical protein
MKKSPQNREVCGLPNVQKAGVGALALAAARDAHALAGLAGRRVRA